MKDLPANFLDGEQQSPEWLKQKHGHVSASRLAEAITKKKRGDGYYATRRDYMDDLIAEILTGNLTEHFVTAEMQFGLDNEDIARSDYEAANEVFIKRVGFVLHPTLPRCGASPDGLVGHDGGLEIKVPKTVTHIRWKRAGIIPAEHRFQMLLNMDCCEREWWDFFSYDPRLKGDLCRFQRRLYRDEKEIKDMREEIGKFLEELTDELIALTSDSPLESKLRDSIRRAGKYPFANEAEERAFQETIVP